MKPFRNVRIYFALLIPVTVWGFWKTYFAILNDLPDGVTWLVHIHALVMFLWLLMLVAQAWFIRTKRLRAHRWVGRSSYVISPLIVLSSLAVLHRFLNRTPQDETLQEVFRLHVLAFGMVVAFVITWGLAIAYRRQPALHVRFIISTAFAVATAIVWRIFYFWVPGCDSDEAATIGNGVALILLLLLLIAADWRMGVKRSAFWVVTIILSIGHLGYWTFARYDGYFAFCRWFAELPSWGNQ